MNAIVGEKLGMTQIFDDESRAIPVTIIKAGPVRVVQVKRQERGFVVVAGLNGDLLLGPSTHSTLSRDGSYARFETRDGRFVRHERGAGALEVRLDHDGHLRVEVGKGSPRSRQ